MMNYRPDVDGLRALAVAAVVVFHAFPSALPGGFTGVDVFFVISGYLITRILRDESVRAGRISLIDFYARRARRILPALLLVVSVVAAMGWFALLAHEYKLLGRHIYSAMLFIYNLRLMSEVGYFDISADMKPLLHLWSLAVEEQFYLVWPILMILALRMRAPLLWVAAGVTALSFACNLYGSFAGWEGIYYNPLARAWQLGIGAVIAALEGRGIYGRSLSNFRGGAVACRVLEWAGLGLIVAGFSLIDRTMLYPGWAAVCPTIGAGLLILCGDVQRGGAARVMAWRPFVVAGLVSYPLYLWHWPFLSFARIMEGGAGGVGNGAVIGAVILSCVAAGLTYVAVERPVKRMKARRIAPVLLGGLVVLFAAGQVIKEKNGLPERENLAFLEDTLAQFARPAQRDEACADLYDPQERLDYCLLSRPAGGMATADKGVIAVVGDSHAHTVFPGLSQAAAEKGYATVLLANSRCLPFPGTTQGTGLDKRTDCMERTRLIQDILNRPEFKAVVIASRGPVYFEGKGFGFAERDMPSFPLLDAQGEPGGEALFFDGLAALAKGAGEADSGIAADRRDVVYVLQVPEIGIEMNACTARPWRLTGREIACSVAMDTMARRMGVYRAGVSALAQGGAFTVVDPQDLFCDATVCHAQDAQGRYLYADDDHMSVYASGLVAPRILSALAAGK